MKRYILIAALALCVSGTKAQDMKALFTNMPDSCIPQLETAWRKDLIDLFNAGKEARLQNTMNGYSVLVKLTEDYLFLQPTERSSIEMKRLPLVNNTYIICTVTTVEGPAQDSRVQFYTTGWQPLDASALFTPVTAAWFLREDVDRESNAWQDAMARLDMDLIAYRLSPDNQNLTATYTTPLYLNHEDRQGILPFLKDAPRVYTWEKSYFK